jgi:hypothetical protein
VYDYALTAFRRQGIFAEYMKTYDFSRKQEKNRPNLMIN